MSKYYDINQTLSYNALFNFIVGVRGCGKTVAAKLWAAKDFIKNGNEFVYVRRYEPDLEAALLNFWAVPKRLDDDYEPFSVKGDRFYYDKQPCGHAISLSTASRYKSSDFDGCNKIIFDEFQCEGSQRYIRGMDEVKVFLNLYESINRERDIPSVFLGNPITITNPYFLYWDIHLPTNGKDIQRFKKHIVVHNISSTEFKDFKKQTKFGSLIDGTDYGSYSIDGSNLNDDERFIKKRPTRTKYWFTALVNNNSYGVWLDLDTMEFYVSTKHDPSYGLTYALDFNSHVENTMVVKSIARLPHVKKMIDSFMNGGLYYETASIKNIFYANLKRMCF